MPRDNIRLSIIIPIYNAAPFVQRCILSIEKQDISKDEYEIICINDGSTDNSGSILKKLKLEFDNIVLFEQENKGVSVARNKGIDLARGKYLMMIDADDFLKPHVLNSRLDLMEQNDLDVGYCTLTVLDEDLKDVFRYDPEYDPNNIQSGIDYEIKHERGNSEVRDANRSVAIFFKKSFLDKHQLRYIEGIVYLEDGEFMARVNCLANRVVFINGVFYLRTTIEGSATQSKLALSQRARQGFLKAASNLMQFKQNYCTHQKEKDYLNQHIIHLTIMYLVTLRRLSYLKQYSQLKRALKSNGLWKLETVGCTRYYKRIGNYYNHSIHLFYVYWLMRIIYKSLKIRVERLVNRP